LKRQRYAPHGMLALAPKAFGLFFDAPEPSAPEVRDGVAIVKIRGPLMHHADWCFDSYDAIKARVALALDGNPKALVLAIDSPGGLVSGCFEAAREIRARAEAAGAAYAIACAADRIVAPSTALVGSIGVVSEILDVTAQDAMLGVAFRAVTSGARKADGNPHVPTTDETVAAVQRNVDTLAAIFLGWVSETRPITADEVRALEAGIFPGVEAVSRGLVDDVASLEQLLASLASETNGSAPTGAASEVTMDEEEKARAALQAIIDGDGDEKSKARARASLKALEAEDGDDDPEKDDEPAAEDEGDEKPAPKDDKKDEDARANAASASAFAESNRLDRIERRQLMATRPDLTEAQRTALASVPVAALEAALSAIPRAPKAAPAATTVVPATRGAGQGGQGAKGAVSSDLVMARAMGLGGDEAAGVVHGANVVTFNARRPAGNGGAR
jgi:ClpP class serine protease